MLMQLVQITSRDVHKNALVSYWEYITH